MYTNNSETATYIRITLTRFVSVHKQLICPTVYSHSQGQLVISSERKVLVAQLCLTLCNPMNYMQPTRLLSQWNSPGKNIAVGCHFLLQGIFLTQEQNSGLLHCRQILYCLSQNPPNNSEIYLSKPAVLKSDPRTPVRSLRPFQGSTKPFIFPTDYLYEVSSYLILTNHSRLNTKAGKKIYPSSLKPNLEKICKNEKNATLLICF